MITFNKKDNLQEAVLKGIQSLFTALKKPIESKDLASPGKPLLLYQKDLLMNTPPGTPQSGLLAKLASKSYLSEKEQIVLSYKSETKQ